MNEISLEKAVVVSPPGLSGPAAKAAEMLLEEVERRAQIRWPVAHTWPEGGVPVIAVGAVPVLRDLAGKHADEDVEAPGPEGYRLRVVGGEAPAVLVAGSDARGVLFGVGRLLRSLRMSRGRLRLAG